MVVAVVTKNGHANSLQNSTLCNEYNEVQYLEFEFLRSEFIV